VRGGSARAGSRTGRSALGDLVCRRDLALAAISLSAPRTAPWFAHVRAFAVPDRGAEPNTSDIDHLFYKQPSTLSLTGHFSYAMLNIQE
jgi:hypothetical protein